MRVGSNPTHSSHNQTHGYRIPRPDSLGWNPRPDSARWFFVWVETGALATTVIKACRLTPSASRIYSRCLGLRAGFHFKSRAAQINRPDASCYVLLLLPPSPPVRHARSLIGHSLSLAATVEHQHVLVQYSTSLRCLLCSSAPCRLQPCLARLARRQACSASGWKLATDAASGNGRMGALHDRLRFDSALMAARSAVARGR